MWLVAVAALVLGGCGDNTTLPPDAAPIADAPCEYKLTAMPTQVSFGSVHVSGASAPGTITITNTGSCSTGRLALSLVGSQADQFVIANPQCTQQDLAAGAACTLDVYFQPNTTGGKAADLVVAAKPRVTIPLDGSGLAGAR